MDYFAGLDVSVKETSGRKRGHRFMSASGQQ